MTVAGTAPSKATHGPPRSSKHAWYRPLHFPFVPKGLFPTTRVGTPFGRDCRPLHFQESGLSRLPIAWFRPAGLYDTPFVDCMLYFGLALLQPYKVGYPYKGVWYEPPLEAQSCPNFRELLKVRGSSGVCSSCTYLFCWGMPGSHFRLFGTAHK